MELYLNLGILAANFIVVTFCVVLSMKIKKLKNLEDGVGAAIAVLSTQVSSLERSMQFAQGRSLSVISELESTVQRAAKLDQSMNLKIGSMDGASAETLTKVILDEEVKRPQTPAFRRSASHNV